MTAMPAFDKATPAWELRWEDDWVTAAAFVGSARRLAAGNQLGGLLVWDLPEAAGGPVPPPARKLDGHTNGITKLLAMPDGRRLISASMDRTIRVWDLDSKPAGEGTVVLDARARETAAKKTGKKPELLPDYKVGVQLAERVLEGHKDWIQSMALSADGKLLASGDDAGNVVVWDTAAWRELRRWSVKGWAYGMAFSPDGARLAVAERVPLVFDSGRHAAVKIWNPATGEVVKDLSAAFGKDHFAAAAFSPDGKQLVLGQGGESSGKIQIADPETGKKVRELPGHQNGVNDVLFSADGKFLISAGRDTTVRVWNAADGKPVKDLGKPRGGQFKDQFHAVTLSPDQTRLAAADMAGLVPIWSVGA